MPEKKTKMRSISFCCLILDYLTMKKLTQFPSLQTKYAVVLPMEFIEEISVSLKVLIKWPGQHSSFIFHYDKFNFFLLKLSVFYVFCYDFLSHLFSYLNIFCIFIVLLEKSNLRTGNKLGIWLIYDVGKFQLLKKSDHCVPGYSVDTLNSWNL